MPSINEVMKGVDGLRPNALEEQDKAKWLLELDGRNYREVTGFDAPEELPSQSWPEDGDKPLLVEAPYDSMYSLYLTAMVEFALGEYGAYNNTCVLFDQARQEWRAAYRREHLPPGCGGYRNVM